MSSLVTFLRYLVISVFALLLSQSYAFASADLSLSPAQGSYDVGSKIVVNVMLSNNTQAINAISGALSFPSDLLTLSSLTKDGSIIKMWAEEPSYSNQTGKVNFEGIILNPGYSSASGKVLTLTFTVKAKGKASLAFSSGSVLANDGNATNVAQNLTGASFSLASTEKPVVESPKEEVVPTVTEKVGAPVLVSSTHPDQTAWYKERIAKFNWSVPSSVTNIRTLLDEAPNSIPTVLHSANTKEKSVDVGADGTYYFHIQFKTNAGWGTITHYTLRVDSVKPEALSIKLLTQSDSSNPKPSFNLSAKDKLSGIAYYALKVDDGEVSKVDAIDDDLTYTVPSVTGGQHVLLVRAVDKAGNAITDSLDFTVRGIEAPTISSYSHTLYAGDPITLSGSTYPNSQVSVILTNSGDKEYKGIALSDKSGLFTLSYDESLEKGTYNLRAMVTTADGAESSYTKALPVKVKDGLLVSLSSYLLNWLSLIIIVIIGCVVVFAATWYSIEKFLAFRRKLKRSMDDAEGALHRDIEVLTEEIQLHHDTLLKVSKKRKLTREEAKILQKFKKHLMITEKDVTAKIGRVKEEL